ncbi:MAG: hypothetical protein CMJ51_03835, partial [Planctomycetaceae bacterium]|nr:hypothetical protein [Planctomycetaceae bacterium]
MDREPASGRQLFIHFPGSDRHDFADGIGGRLEPRDSHDWETIFMSYGFNTPDFGGYNNCFSDFSNFSGPCPTDFAPFVGGYTGNYGAPYGGFTGNWNAPFVGGYTGNYGAPYG